MNIKSYEASNSQPFLSTGAPGESTVSYLVEEYERWQSLFEAQPALIQRFFETQARTLANALLQPASQVEFRLPDRVVTSTDGTVQIPLPPEQREQMVGLWTA